jgi:hypothetical protein
MFVSSYQQNIIAPKNTRNNTALTLKSKVVGVCTTHYFTHVTQLVYSVFRINLALRKNLILVGLAHFFTLINMQCSAFSSAEYLYMV